jgi:hypothetical protein
MFGDTASPANKRRNLRPEPEGRRQAPGPAPRGAESRLCPRRQSQPLQAAGEPQPKMISFPRIPLFPEPPRLVPICDRSARVRARLNKIESETISAEVREPVRAETLPKNSSSEAVEKRRSPDAGALHPRRGRGAIEAAIGNHYGHRNATMILLTYRHRLRAAEVCDPRWDQVDFNGAMLHVRRVKNGTRSIHPIQGDELRALRQRAVASPFKGSCSSPGPSHRPPRERVNKKASLDARPRRFFCGG